MENHVMLTGLIHTIRNAHGTISYKDGSHDLIVPFDMTSQLANSRHGDHVSFHIVLDNYGYCKATQIHVIPSSSHVIPSNYIIGTVCSNKGHGVITRHDNGEDVFYDCSSVELSNGDCVRFLLDGKSVATNITTIPEAGINLGVVTKPANQKEMGKLVSEVMGAGCEEVSFHDVQNRPTLLRGDVVTFYHPGSCANHVILHTLVEQLNKSIPRHVGKVTEVLDSGYYGYVSYNEGTLPFHGHQIVNKGWAPSVGEEVMFSVANSDEEAIRISHPSPSILQNDWLDGVVRDGYKISYLSDQDECSIKIRHNKNYDIGDHVTFQIVGGAACNIIVGGATASSEDMTSCRGFVATLRDGFGFIECEDRSCEVFFSFSACHDDINPHTLQLLDEVEFQLVTKAGKTSASNVQLLPVGTISREESVTAYQDGVVLRAMKSMDKKGYYEGVIQSSASPDQQLPYSISSLADPMVALQAGDVVQFKVGLLSGQHRATSVVCTRQFITGLVESLKSKERYGFISYKDTGGMSRSVFFHMSNVEHGEEVAVGDQVKFQLSFSQRAQKHSASHVSRLQAATSNKPGWLVRRESNANIPVEFCVIRQPHGPDKNRKGFNS
ncbi:cold shock domain-containing protein E1-like isoform X2 [Dysidea avara]|uniref:cold shock domain-containing protein E1-like isoform X2 n=1 Tax=Dysidea avara TaxID=196820 RepID=UPI003319E773